MKFRPIACSAVATLSACLLLAGCASTALSPGRSVLDVADAKNHAAQSIGQPVANASFTPHPSGFAWANQNLEATGSGRAPEGVSGPQHTVAARNAAMVQALTNLKEQVRALPVGSDETVGSIMKSYMTIRVAVEDEIAKAQPHTVSPRPDGSTEVQVSLPLAPIAEILQDYRITTDQELPEAIDSTVNVSSKII